MNAAARKRALSARDSPRTIAIPIDALGLEHISVVAAPPALITRLNGDHLGMTGDAVVRALCEMRAHPRYREHVIARGKYRAAPPEAIIAYLREVPEAASEEEDDELDGSLLRAAGFATPAANQGGKKAGAK